jgi:mersacidin/lichenicidin family type 2 lantibiotic
MSSVDVIRAWKDPRYRASLSDAQRARLPANPAGLVEIDDAYLDAVAGGQRPPGTSSLGSRCWNCTTWD